MKRLALAALLLGGCTQTAAPSPETAKPAPLRAGLDADGKAFASSYVAHPEGVTALVGATVLTGTGAELRNATVVMRGGRIEAVGSDVAVPDGATRIDAAGRWVTPGIIDAHSHLGAWSQPDVPAHDDVNEMSDPNTAQVWVEHSIWPQDPGFDTAREAGVTTMQVLPGSGNLFGGRSVTLKNVPALTVQGMKFPGAPQGLKIACGENPKRVYGAKGRAPSTRMGNVAGYRKAWIDAADYARRWDKWRKAGTGDPPKRDLQLETLAGVLRGEILVHVEPVPVPPGGYVAALSRHGGRLFAKLEHQALLVSGSVLAVLLITGVTTIEAESLSRLVTRTSCGLRPEYAG